MDKKEDTFKKCFECGMFGKELKTYNRCVDCNKTKKATTYKKFYACNTNK
jgi:hypothetical protein